MRESAPIGVFDSGIGGLSVLAALRAEMPAERFVYFADNGFAPYGERGDAFVLARTRQVADYLIGRHGIKALVVACNSATAAAVHAVRAEHPALCVVGIEPALKPALAASRTGYVAVLATRVTLESAKFRALQKTLARPGTNAIRVVPCDGLAGAIERADEAAIARLAEQYLSAAGEFGTGAGQIDTLVLGCTHYPFIADRLRARVGNEVRLIDAGVPVARQTRRLLEAAALLAADAPAGSGMRLLCSGPAATLDSAYLRWVGDPPAAMAERVPLPLNEPATSTDMPADLSTSSRSP